MAAFAAHVRYRTIEYLREPFAIIPTLAFPFMITAFFVLPNTDPESGTHALVVVLLLSFTMIALFNFGAGTAEERRLPWDAFLRALPLPAWQALGARLVVGLGFACLGAAPALLLLASRVDAAVPAQRWPGVAAAITLGAIAMTGLGLAIGHALPYKAAVATTNLVFLPMAFVGGLFIPARMLPDWAAAIGAVTPLRPWVEVSLAAAAGDPPAAGWWIALLAWTVLLCTAAGWTYHRDQAIRYT